MKDQSSVVATPLEPMSQTARVGVARTLAALLRVPEWTKNFFVFAPLLFSGRLIHHESVWKVTLVGAALCALSSSIYIVNDMMDMVSDREHPKKRLRPLASGAVSRGTAEGVAVVAVLTGFVLLAAAQAPPSVVLMAAGFLALNVAYTLYLKRKVIVDVLAIAVGYCLRVLIGGAAIHVEVTHWLILCTFLLATFLGFSKRRHELAVLGPESRRHRPVLSLYTDAFLDRMSMLTLAMTLTCYMLYTISPETIARFGTNALVYSSLIVMFALFRYLFLIHVKKMGSPVEVLYYDRQIVLAIVTWILYIVGVVYTWPAIRGLLR